MVVLDVSAMPRGRTNIDHIRLIRPAGGNMAVNKETF